MISRFVSKLVNNSKLGTKLDENQAFFFLAWQGQFAPLGV